MLGVSLAFSDEFVGDATAEPPSFRFAAFEMQKVFAFHSLKARFAEICLLYEAHHKMRRRLLFYLNCSTV